jgi:peroxiredoxin Q/BCP
VHLAALRGHPVVLYFYPKDDTPGCTREACELRDAYQAILGTGAVIIGISTQDNASHAAFADKYHLPFLLVPDDGGRIARAYRVPLILGLARRVTFVIGRDGNVAKVFPNVTPTGHAAEVLAAIQALPGGA